MSQEVQRPLSWQERLNIIKGTAKAVHHLHTAQPCMVICGNITRCQCEAISTASRCSVMMLHWNKLVLCCVHSSNILLDEHLQPRLSDFGLARLRPHSVDQSCTIVMYTASHSNLGYLPEEYIRDGKLSVKLDVYSLGMVSAASCLTYYIPETGIICTNKDYVCILMLIIQLQETFVYFFIVLHLLLACHDWPNIIEHFSLHFF